LPLFLLPILAFIAWISLTIYYLPVLRQALTLGDQLLASFLFISHSILIFSWSVAGLSLTAVLTACVSLVVLYLCLALKEPALFIQVLIYSTLVAALTLFFHEIQKKLNNHLILREKIQEELTASRNQMIKETELEKALNRKINRFLTLHQFAEILRDMSTVSELAHCVVAEAHELVKQAEECVLYLVDEKNEELSLVATTLGKNVQSQTPSSVFDQWAVRRSRPLMIEDSRNDFRFSTEKNSDADLLRSVCVSPLMTENRVFGVLRASSQKASAFSSDDLHALDILSGLAAVILRNRFLYDKMEELSVHDGLTGLYLNRYFQQRLSEEFSRVRSRDTPFSLIMLDVDHFKKYNDEFGHTAGDLVLKHIASILQRCLAPSEVAARYGGEEFIVLLPDKGKKDAMELAEQIRAEFANYKFALRRAQGVVTASFGVVSYPEDGKTRETLLGAADHNLYQAKTRGRNRVCGNT